MIPKNPLTMTGTIRRCWLFAYQSPIEEATKVLPAHLELVTHGRFAFWNVVVCQIGSMRPKGIPSPFGITYWHVGYRLYVRFRPKSGKPIEGLYFLRSDCDNRLISRFGNLMTDFNFHVAKILVTSETNSSRLTIDSSEAPAEVRWNHNKPSLASYSAFDSLENAASFLKYKPFGISTTRGGANIVKIVRDEKAWRFKLVNVLSEKWKFFEHKNVRLEACYEVDPIRYEWRRGERYEGNLAER